MASRNRIVTENVIWHPPNTGGLTDETFDFSEHRIQKDAAEDGRKGLPHSSDKKQFGVQGSIWDAAKAGCDDLKAMFLRSVGEVRNLLSENCAMGDVRCTRTEMTEDDEDMKKQRRRHPNLFTQSDGVKNSARGDLLNLKIDMEEKNSDLKYFRVENKLGARKAQYPDSNVLNYALVIGAVLIESILNGAMFRDVAAGLIGGAQLAFFFSLINILLGLFIGFWGVKNLIHVNPARKVMGGLVVAILGVCGIGWNFFIAHYREMAQTGDGLEEQVNAFKTMIQHPFNLASPEAYALLFFGAMIFAYMVYKAYRTFDDPYPGYGKMQRRYENARSDYIEAQQHLRDDVSDIFIAEREDIYEQLDEEEMNANEAKRLLSEVTAHRDDIIGSMTRVVDKGNRLLSEYRDTNVKFRKTEEPEHFNEHLTIDGFTKTRDGETLGDAEIKKLKEKVSKLSQKQKSNAEKLERFMDDTHIIQKYVEDHLETNFFDEVKEAALKHIHIDDRVISKRRPSHNGQD